MRLEQWQRCRWIDRPEHKVLWCTLDREDDTGCDAPFRRGAAGAEAVAATSSHPALNDRSQHRAPRRVVRPRAPSSCSVAAILRPPRDRRGVATQR
jgi:hypothetical protein